MTVNELLSAALVLYLQSGKGQELEYISKSETSLIGWYFWLKHSPGVYEIELKEDEKESLLEEEKADFFVRYYPALKEKVLESYSVSEQLIRFNKAVFDDSLITVHEEEHELCPCCTTSRAAYLKPEEFHEEPCTCKNHHGNHETKNILPRTKGIPRMLKKFNMAKNLFVIGILTIQIKDETNSFQVILKTKKQLVTKAQENIVLYQNSKPVVVVGENEIDRNVPGYILTKRFMNFFGGQFLCKVSEEKNQISGKGGLKKRKSCSKSDLSDISIQYAW